VDAAGATHIVWPTLVKPATPYGEPRLALFYATSRDGVSFSPRTALPTEGAAHHPQIAAARDGSLALAWDEVEGGGRHAVVARATTADGRIRTRAIESPAAAGRLPVWRPPGMSWYWRGAAGWARVRRQVAQSPTSGPGNGCLTSSGHQCDRSSARSSRAVRGRRRLARRIRAFAPTIGSRRALLARVKANPADAEAAAALSSLVCGDTDSAHSWLKPPSAEARRGGCPWQLTRDREHLAQKAIFRQLGLAKPSG
jgi:hypothetical protein